MKVVNDGQEKSNGLSIIIFEKKKYLITKLSFKHPPCHLSIKTKHYPRCIENQPMSALADCEETSRLVIFFSFWLAHSDDSKHTKFETFLTRTALSEAM